ncbi:hypothetical protein INT47_000815 [Mucor saturninus]|uniref:F-box domain-containing protein n=1 Tax=Mucor saturninus TaxID=64648 RepID=A0A8H7RMJ3_9FUNG|nr:hypothetical protein INT47_000815 [Mucor saturninus]
MNNIGFEILTRVFSHLYKTDVTQCLFVCKSWKEAGLPFVHRDLTWTSRQVTRLKKRMKLRPITRDHYFKQGILTKTLRIDQDHSDYLTYDTEMDTYEKPDLSYAFDKKDWLALLKYLPNLEVLDFSESANGNRYLRYIKDADTNILPKIQVMLNDEQVPCMFGNYDNIYLGACYRHRATITTLHINYKQSVIGMGSINIQMLTLLREFNNLTHLTFNNKYDDQLTTLDIQDACPHLILLKYRSNFGIPDFKVKAILDEPDPEKLDHKLVEMKIVVPSITKNYAKYIINYISPYVDRLVLIMKGVDLCDWIHEIGHDTVLDLLRSFDTTTTSFSINWLPGKNYKRHSIHDDSDTTIFFSLLHALRGNKRMFCDGDYGDINPLHKSIQYSPETGLHVKYGLGYFDYCFQTMQNTGVGTDTDPSNRSILVALPNNSVSTIGPEIIHSLQIEMRDRDPALHMKFLQYALSNYPNLQYFYYHSIICGYQILLGPDTKARRHGLENRNSLTNTLKENIKAIKIRNMLPSEELIYLIRTYMPDFKTLICGGKPPSMDQATCINVDLTELRHLNSIYLDATCLDVRETHTVFMGIQCYGGVQTYYSLGIKKNRCTIDSIPLDYMEQQTRREDINTQATIFQCGRRDIKFVVFYGYDRIAEIVNGQLVQLRKTKHIDFGLFV